MKKNTIDRERTVVAHNQASEVSQPAIGASQDSSVLSGRPNAIPLVRTDQFDSALPQALPQRIAVVGFVGNHAHRLLPRTARVMAPSYSDRRERRLRELDFRGRSGAKLPSRNESLHFNCWRSFNSLRNVRQIFNQTPRSAESKESLPAHDDSRSTDDHLCVVWAAWGARARFSSTALQSATDRIAPSALLRRC
jgi:hypothetical protein